MMVLRMRPIGAVGLVLASACDRMTRWRFQGVQKRLTSYAQLLSFDDGFYASTKPLETRHSLMVSVTVHSVNL